MDNLLYHLIKTKLKNHLPMESGNLKFNAFKSTKNQHFAEFKVDISVAPYFEWLDKGLGPTKVYKGIFDDMKALTANEISSYHSVKRKADLNRKLKIRERAIEHDDEVSDHAARYRRYHYWKNKNRGDYS